ncbi:MAG: bifunctional (p)ppGpp synthetase/guanosine-3',5'-bis(diphosphate) 3'-pyrophosphohydrolase [Candidatus Marinimicrobia bacterium]|nr:bifunctional (p)ppGpp synthetase/guanosine-3',5'-bis(diphosphate) 3'-pyrophosphohydrolase [Candidatus Neomarinimicrobiota bacterium]
MVLSALKQFIPRASDPYPKGIMAILNKFEARSLDDPGISLLKKAYEYGEKAHKGQKRRSGEPYFIHCIQVAETLSEWNCDNDTIAAGILHDTIEDTDITKEDIASEFNPTIAELVWGVSKLSGIKFNSRQQKQAENFMRLFLNVADDIRVIIIKFADRLHNMKTLNHLPLLKQQRIARETRDVFAPLAHRLGMGRLKSEFEDLCLGVIDPDGFKHLEKKVNTTKTQREKYIDEFIKPINEQLAKDNVNIEIFGRAKHYYSIYRKMKTRGKLFEDIFDLLAIRIIVDKVEDCYMVLGHIHQLYKPLIERFKDYISTPKINGYQSLHTTVFGKQGRLVEVQIRTKSMDRIAEVGVAAHWVYKEKGSVKSPDEDYNKQVEWLRELVDVLQSEDKNPEEFFNLLKIDLFQEEIFIFSPKGDLFRLAIGSTPVDFAFNVHTQVGIHCIGAKVNGKMVPLNTELHNSDTVEILTSPNHHPSMAWLKFVKTGKAQSIIKRWYNKEEFQRSVALGKEMLDKTLRRLKKSSLIKEIQKDPETAGYPNLEALYSVVGRGQLTIRKLLEKYIPEEMELSSIPTAETLTERFISRARGVSKGILVDGIENAMLNFGKCCNPIPGDDIVGFVTRGRGVSVHKSDCRNLPVSESEERIIPVEWNTSRNQSFIARLKITAEDRKQLLRDVAEKLGLLDINIVNLEFSASEGIATGNLIIQVRDTRQYDKIKRNLKSIKGIIHLERK